MKLDEELIHETLTRIRDGNIIGLNYEDVGITLAYYAILECLSYGMRRGNSVSFCGGYGANDLFQYALDEMGIVGKFSHGGYILTINTHPINFLWDSKQAERGSLLLIHDQIPTITHNYMAYDDTYTACTSFIARAGQFAGREHKYQINPILFGMDTILQQPISRITCV